MTVEKLKTAVENLSAYLEECHGEDDTVTFTTNVVRSIKENYEELIKYKEDYGDLINRQKAEIERLKAKNQSLYKEIERIALMTDEKDEKEMVGENDV